MTSATRQMERLVALEELSARQHEVISTIVGTLRDVEARVLRARKEKGEDHRSPAPGAERVLSSPRSVLERDPDLAVAQEYAGGIDVLRVLRADAARRTTMAWTPSTGTSVFAAGKEWTHQLRSVASSQAVATSPSSPPVGLTAPPPPRAKQVQKWADEKGNTAELSPETGIVTVRFVYRPLGILLGGADVVDLTPGSFAATCLCKQDELVNVNGQPISGLSEDDVVALLQTMASSVGADSPAELHFLRHVAGQSTMLSPAMEARIEAQAARRVADAATATAVEAERVADAKEQAKLRARERTLDAYRKVRREREIKERRQADAKLRRAQVESELLEEKARQAAQRTEQATAVRKAHEDAVVHRKAAEADLEAARSAEVEQFKRERDEWRVRLAEERASRAGRVLARRLALEAMSPERRRKLFGGVSPKELAAKRRDAAALEALADRLRVAEARALLNASRRAAVECTKKRLEAEAALRRALREERVAAERELTEAEKAAAMEPIQAESAVAVGHAKCVLQKAALRVAHLDAAAADVIVEAGGHLAWVADGQQDASAVETLQSPPGLPPESPPESPPEPPEESHIPPAAPRVFSLPPRLSVIVMARVQAMMKRVRYKIQVRHASVKGQRRRVTFPSPSLGMQLRHGVMIGGVPRDAIVKAMKPSSPGAKEGVRPGDRITRVNEKDASGEGYRAIVATLKTLAEAATPTTPLVVEFVDMPNRSLTLDGSSLALAIPSRVSDVNVEVSFTSEPFGVKLESLEGDQGVFVSKLRPGTLASMMLRAGDRVIRFCGRDVGELPLVEIKALLRRAQHDASPEDPKVLVVERSLVRTKTLAARQMALSRLTSAPTMSALDLGATIVEEEEGEDDEDASVSAELYERKRELLAGKRVHTEVNFTAKDLRRLTVGAMKKNLEDFTGHMVKALTICVETKPGVFKDIVEVTDDEKTLLATGFKTENLVRVTWKGTVRQPPPRRDAVGVPRVTGGRGMEEKKPDAE